MPIQIKIMINNSYTQITGLNTQLFQELRKELSYGESAIKSFFSAFGPKTFYLLDKRGNFPSGLLSRVRRFLKTKGLAFAETDVRVVPNYAFGEVFSELAGIRLYPDQARSLAAVRANTRGIISMPTGAGKSLVIASVVKTFNGLNVLVVVPNLELKSQLSSTINETLPNMTKNVTIMNIDSPALLKSTKKYDVLIIDECHHVGASTYQKLNKTVWKDIYYRFYFTATPFRNQKEEQLLFEGIAGDIIYQLSYKEAIAAKYIVPVEGYYLEVPKCSPQGYTWAQIYKELVVEHDIRNNMIAGMVEALKDNYTMVLVKEIQHGETLAKLANIPFANGQDEESRKYIKQFSQGKIKQLIGTVGVLGEGVDTKPCEYVIIAGLGKAKSSFMQQVGRAVRNYPGKESAKIILIHDKSHKWSKAHFKEQSKIMLCEYGTNVIKLELP